eukprot:gene3365-21760_t
MEEEEEEEDENRYKHGVELTSVNEDAKDKGGARDHSSGSGNADSGARSAVGSGGIEDKHAAARKARAQSKAAAASGIPTSAKKMKKVGLAGAIIVSMKKAASGRDGHKAVISPDLYTDAERLKTLATPGKHRNANSGIVQAVKDRDMVVMVMWLLMNCVGMQMTTMEEPGEKSSEGNTCRALGNALLTMICGAISSEMTYTEMVDKVVLTKGASAGGGNAANDATAEGDHDTPVPPTPSPFENPQTRRISLWQYYLPMQLSHPLPLPEQPTSPTPECEDLGAGINLLQTVPFARPTWDVLKGEATISTADAASPSDAPSPQRLHNNGLPNDRSLIRKSPTTGLP